MCVCVYFEQFWRVEFLPIFLFTSMIHTEASFLGHVLCLFAFCWCQGAAIDALPTLNVKMVPLADTRPEISTEFRSWREEVVTTTKVCVWLVCFFW